ncbi:MAG TPA: hypothetical protein VGH60_07030 [Solirubrobacteraceae bacterium]
MKLAFGCVLAVGVLALGAGSADAAGYENFCVTLGSPPLCGGGLGQPFGVAVDNSSTPGTAGDVYVAGLGFTVSRFTETGQTAPFTGKNSNISGSVLGGFTFAVGVAVDPATGAFYVTDRAGGGNVLDKFSAAGEPEGAPIALTGFTEATGVAVDRSGGPSAGDIYVAEGSAHGKVDKLNSTGTTVLAELTAEGAPLDEPYSVAVDGSGNVYVATFNHSLFKFNEKGELQSPSLDTNSVQAVAVDPSTNNVFVVDEGGTMVHVFSSAGAPLESFGGLGGFSAGIAVNGSNHHVFVSNLLNGTASIFGKAFEGPPPPPPVTGAATAVKGSTAVLHGTVNREAGNKEGLKYHFAYSSTGTCDGPGSEQTPAGEIAEGEEPVAVETKAEGLLGKTTYKFCLVATNPGESTVSAGEESFTTEAAPPKIAAQSASEITPTTAMTHAAVNPGGAETTCKVEYGVKALSEEVEHSEPCAAALGEGVASVPVSVELKGLAPATKYHYRFSATNTSEGGTQVTSGAETELETLPLALTTTEAASQIAPESATLNGTVKINGGESPEYYFEYTGGPATCESFGCPRTVQKPVQGETITEALQGLSPQTVYHARLVVVVQFKGSPVAIPGGEVEFMTQPLAVAATGTASQIAPEGATLNGTVTLKTTDPTNYYFEYGETIGEAKTTPVAISGEGEHTIEATVTGLHPHAQYHYRLVVEVVGHPPLVTGQEGEFTTLILAPAVTNAPPSSVTRHTATLPGEVDAHSGETTYLIEYGVSTAYGRATPVAVMQAHEGAQPIEALTLGELQAGTTYHYRIVASNSTGTTDGPDATFTTSAPILPTAVTGGAVDVTQTSAFVTAGIDTHGLQTSYVLEVGSEVEGSLSYTPTYGEIGGGAEIVGLAFTLQGLQPGTTYHYRITAHNEDGAVTGADRTFTTAGFPAAISAPPAVQIIPFNPPIEAKPASTRSTPETKAQKLAKALKACKRQPKRKQAQCRKRAQRQYGPARKTKKQKRG